MTTLTISIIVVFVLGYALIATESLTKVNKAAIALLMLVGCWTLYMVDPMQYLQLMHPDYTGGAAGMVEKVTGIIQEHLGDTATTLFFLMGAMTIVEIVDQNGGFNWVRKVMKTKSKRALLWRIAILTFFLSAILDNLTTSIVMIMILRKLVTDHKDRMVYASLVIIAANSGGAFSPIGDVTTIMLWNKGLITAAGVIAEIFIPSVVSMVIPALILQTMLKGELVMPEVSKEYPVVISQFMTETNEIEFDGVAQNGEIVEYGISEHVEYAGVHSGDATMTFPAQQISFATARQIKKISRAIAKELNISGPFNIQYLAKGRDVKVIECNLRASRSFPFVSKVLKRNFIETATRIMLDAPYQKPDKSAFDIDRMGVKASQFSFARLQNADPVLGVDMSSTGEVGCMGDTFEEALLDSLIVTG